MADSSKDIQLHELKDMINDLKKMIKTLQATVDAGNKREEALTQERDNLKEEIDLLRKKLFGTSSEKRTIDIPGQLNFFNEAELEQNPDSCIFLHTSNRLLYLSVPPCSLGIFLIHITSSASICFPVTAHFPFCAE